MGNISDNAFRGTENEMTVLNIEGNSMAPPQTNALRKLVELRELTMKNYKVAHLSELPTDLYFQSFRKLEKLTLDGWGIQSIDAHAFMASDNLYSLRSLALINQKLSSIPIDALRAPELQNLESLRISNTKIRDVTAYAFSSLNNIKEIVLSDNEINSIEEDSFENVGDTLKKIDFGNNFLGASQHDDLPQLKGLPVLTQLSLSKNEFSAMPRLENLGTGHAFHLDFSKNDLRRLSANDLSSFITRLQGLDLSQNDIAQIDDNTFNGSSALNSLILNFQGGSTTAGLNVPTSLRNAADSLTYLDMSGQRVEETSLWQILGQLTNLQTLLLHSTELTSIPDFALENLATLKKLDLSYNPGIVKLTDKTFVGPRTLQTLAIRSTGVTSVPACLFHNHIGSLSLDMGFTQITCDCAVKTLLERIRDGIVTFPDAQSVPVCTDGFPLAQKDPADLITCASEECVNYYTTPSPTQPPSPESTDSPMPTPTIQIQVMNITANTIAVSWNIKGFRHFQKFRVLLSSDQQTKEFHITSMSVKTQNIQGLTEDTNYRVCVFAYFASILPVSACKSIRTKSAPPSLPESEPSSEPSVPIPAVQIRVLDIDSGGMRIAWDITNTTELQYYKVTVSSEHTTKSYDQQSFNVTKQIQQGLTPNAHHTEVCVYAYFTSDRPVSLCQSVLTKTDPN